MKARPSKTDPSAFTLIELIAIIVTIILIVCLVPALVRTRDKARDKQCVDNLKQVGIAFKTWAFSGDQFAMGVPTNGGGTKELIDSGQVFVHFRAVSNELKTVKMLACPGDKEKQTAAGFGSLSDSNVSYFVGVEAQDTYPQMLLSGDRNLALNGQPLKPGLFVLTTSNTQLSWTKAIHNSCGNIGFADGSVRLLDSKALSQAAQNQGFPDTNRLAIP